MIKRKLLMDDIRVGMYITQTKGKVDQRMMPGLEGPAMRSKEYDRLNGRVLEVVAIDMPFVVVLAHDSRTSRRDVIDMRQVEVMALSPSYIIALLPKFEFKEDHFWDGIQLSEMMDTELNEIMKNKSSSTE